MNNIDKMMVAKIEEWIDLMMPELTEDFFRILKIPSVAEVETKNSEFLPFGQGCRQVLQEMLQIGKKYGFSTEDYDHYVGRISYGEKGSSIGIWAHLDVVESGEGWEYQPYMPIEKNGYVIARGAQDNKSSAIMGLYALRYLKEHHLDLNYTVSLYCGTCEEKGMLDIDYFTEHNEPPMLSLVPDSSFPVCQGERGAFNGKLTSHDRLSSEITELETSKGLYMVPEWAQISIRNTKERKGRLELLPDGITVQEKDGFLKIRSKGVSAHAMNPVHGIHALKTLVEFLKIREIIGQEDWKIISLADKINQDSIGTALDLNCEDGISGSIILTQTEAWMEDGHLVMNFISKYPVTMGAMDFGRIAGNAAEAQGYSMETTRVKQPCYRPSNHPVLKTLCDTYNMIENRNDKPFIMSGGTYAGKLPNSFAFGTSVPLPPIPEGMFLPGHGSFHQPDECIAVLRIKRALKIYILSLLQLNQLDEIKIKGEETW